MEIGWPKWAANLSADYLPQRRDALAAKLSSDEIDLLAPPIFGQKSPTSEQLGRARVLDLLATSKAEKHHELCLDLEAKLNAKLAEQLTGFGAFARLADAGYAFMNEVWNAFPDSKAFSPSISCAELAQRSEVKTATAELSQASKIWIKSKHPTAPEFRPANQLASICLGSAGDRLVRKLITFHIDNRGGRDWFEISSKGEVARASPFGSQEGSPYRYRLFAMARLAVQAGRLGRVPSALLDDPDEETGE